MGVYRFTFPVVATVLDVERVGHGCSHAGEIAYVGAQIGNSECRGRG